MRRYTVNMIRASMATLGSFYPNQQEINLRNDAELLETHSKWVTLRTATITNLLNGNVIQEMSCIATAVALANNIPRRSMEFVANCIESTEEEDDDLTHRNEPYYDVENNRKVQDDLEGDEDASDVDEDYRDMDEYYYERNYDYEYEKTFI
jgi:hypothetical protein